MGFEIDGHRVHGVLDTEVFELSNSATFFSVGTLTADGSLEAPVIVTSPPRNNSHVFTIGLLATPYFTATLLNVRFGFCRSPRNSSPSISQSIWQRQLLGVLRSLPS
jgi:hypothetical protein